jgi:hypothetical protein
VCLVVLTKKRSVLCIRGTTNKLEDVGAERIQQGDDCSNQRDPVDPCILLVSENSQETKSNDQGTCDIALVLLIFDITDGSGTQEDKTKDDKDTDPDGRSIVLDTGESLEKVNNSGENNPSVP